MRLTMLMLLGALLSLLAGLGWDLLYPPTPPLAALALSALFALFMLLVEVFDRNTPSVGISRAIIGVWLVYLALCLAAAGVQLHEANACPCAPCACEGCSCPAQP